jgi:hypothetical protein
MTDCALCQERLRGVAPRPNVSLRKRDQRQIPVYRLAPRCAGGPGWFVGTAADPQHRLATVHGVNPASGQYAVVACADACVALGAARLLAVSPRVTMAELGMLAVDCGAASDAAVAALLREIDRGVLRVEYEGARPIAVALTNLGSGPVGAAGRA